MVLTLCTPIHHRYIHKPPRRLKDLQESGAGLRDGHAPHTRHPSHPGTKLRGYHTRIHRDDRDAAVFEVTRHRLRDHVHGSLARVNPVRCVVSTMQTFPPGVVCDTVYVKKRRQHGYGGEGRSVTS